jgi:hypothetical protein
MHMNIYANAYVSVREGATIIRDQSRKYKPWEADISQAACKHRKAIFGPTPGSEQSSSTVFGTSELKSSRRRCAACLIYLDSISHENAEEERVRTDCVFRRQNPTLLMESAMTCSSAARRASRLTVPPSATRSLSTAASVTSSFVCDESMSEMSVAKRLFYTPIAMQIRTKKTRKKGGQAYRAPVDPSPSTWPCRNPSCPQEQGTASAFP